MKVFIPFCEWDIGLRFAYATYEGFKEHATKLLEASSIEEPFDECLEEGLIGGDWETLGP